MFNNCISKNIEYFYETLMKINIDNVDFEDIETIINSIFLCGINYCAKHNSLLSINREFKIIRCPEFLFFILDINRNIYNTKKEHIINLFKGKISINGIFYLSKGIIFIPTNNHYTSCVLNLEEEILNFKNGDNIYHDDMLNNGNVLLIINYINEM